MHTRHLAHLTSLSETNREVTMKKIMILAITIFALISLFADEPQSMRYVASDGVFEGVWDRVYDPIYLKDFEKTYFFTNFADFSIKYSDVFGELNENDETRFFEEFPFGLVFTNPFMKNLKHAFFLSFRMNEIPGYLSGWHKGELEIYETEYIDTTGDDVYDIKVMNYRNEIEEEENENMYNFVWNNNIQLDRLSLGIKFSSHQSQIKIDNSHSYLGMNNFGNYGLLYGFDYGDYQVDYFTEVYNIDEDDFYFRYFEKGDFNTVISDEYNGLLLSCDLGGNDTMLRFDLGADLHKNISRDTEDIYTGGYEEIILADTLVRTGDICETYERKVQANQTKLFTSALYRKNLESVFAGEFGFWETGVKLGYLTGDRENNIRNHFYSEEITDSLDSVEYTLIQKTDDLMEITETGDLSGLDLAMHFRMNLPLNDFALFGLGCYYTYSNTSGNYDYTNELLNVESYRIGSEFDSADEYIQTETEYLSADKQSIIDASLFRFPIALEFKIPDGHTSLNDGFGLRNFVFRLGTTFFLHSTKTENTYDVIEKNPNFVITEYGDGIITENHDSENSLGSEKETFKQVESKKRFSAGISYKHSDNVSIDLGGYYDYNTENYFAGISFTISR